MQKAKGLDRRWCGCALMLPGLTALLVASGDRQLVEAVRDRNATAVRALLQQRVDVNASQPDGATALHWAAHWDDVETADLLLRAGAEVNVANELGVTPLDLACENRSFGMVSRFLQAGADTKAAAPTRPPVLMSCARTGSVEAVKALLARGASVNQREPRLGQTALMWAVAGRHPGVVQVLLEAGADVHARSRVTRLTVNRADPNDTYRSVIGEVRRGGSTALLLAAREGDDESARLLLDRGANVNDIAPDGNSALVIAAHSNQAAVANLLLDRGADPNAIGAGYTALHAAVTERQCRSREEVAGARRSRGFADQKRYAHHSVRPGNSSYPRRLSAPRRFCWRPGSSKSTSCGCWRTAAPIRGRR